MRPHAPARTRAPTCTHMQTLDTCPDKHKAEQAALAAKSGKKNLKTLHGGKGGLSAGLDDYVYDDAGNGDDYDFM